MLHAMLICNIYDLILYGSHAHKWPADYDVTCIMTSSITRLLALKLETCVFSGFLCLYWIAIHHKNELDPAFLYTETNDNPYRNCLVNNMILFFLYH